MITSNETLQKHIQDLEALDADYVSIANKPDTDPIHELLKESVLSRIRQMQVDIMEYIKLRDRKAKYEQGE